MTAHVTYRRVEEPQPGDRTAVIVQDSQTKQRFVVLPQDTFDRARVLFDYLTMRSEAEAAATDGADEWSDVDNARRVTLINKKHDARLTRAEDRELAALQQRAYRHRERVAPVRNEVLRLLAEALERRGRTKSQSA